MPKLTHDEEESALFSESVETLKSQREKFIVVMEAMEKKPWLQLQLINQFLNTFP